jgi:hypothetical protein
LRFVLGCVEPGGVLENDEGRVAFHIVDALRIETDTVCSPRDGRLVFSCARYAIRLVLCTSFSLIAAYDVTSREYQDIQAVESNSLLFLSTRLKLWRYIVAVKLQLLSHGWVSRCAEQWCLVDTRPL